MAIKTVDAWATDVADMGFDNIKKDNELFNAVSKAQAKAFNKEQFNYLNDKNRDPEDLYLKHIKSNGINVSGALQKAAAESCTGPDADKAKAKKAIAAIDEEVRGLFKKNLRQNIVKDVSFKTWVEAQNEPEILKMAAKNAKTAVKKLGIRNEDLLEKALASMMRGDKDEALKALTKLAKEEELQDKADALLKSLEKAGLA